MNKKCKNTSCKKICAIPSWIYCSDECNRISLNSRNLIKARIKRICLKTTL